ncbi:MAG: fumarate/nitrate reduction transcriptional regulator Fnr [Cellvibrionaceae bacterium]
MKDTVAPTQCPHNKQVSCSNCRLSSLCLPLSLELDELEQIDDVILRNQPLQKGDYLYRAGDNFSSIYAVRAGCIKSVRITEEGEEQIIGFYLPGEILGMDGLNTDNHPNSAIALETSAICEIPFHRLEELSRHIPSLQRHFFQLMSKEIINDQELITLLSKGSAEQRIAALLLSLSSRHQRRQLSATEFSLPMSRTDMGNYLGLTIETVSRVFGRFQKEGCLSVNRRLIDLLDVKKLKRIASN